MSAAILNAGDILIVDNRPEDLASLRNILEDQGYNVRPAVNGDTGMQIVRSQPPEIILLDARMPDKNGYQFCRELKSRSETRDIPIIFISSLTDLDDKIRGFSSGGVDFITKPFLDKEVLARVKTHLTISRLRKHLQRENKLLEQSLTEMKQLQEYIAICSWCKKIRDEAGCWRKVEEYFAEKSDTFFSHRMCPSCTNKDIS